MPFLNLYAQWPLPLILCYRLLFSPSSFSMPSPLLLIPDHPIAPCQPILFSITSSSKLYHPVFFTHHHASLLSHTISLLFPTTLPPYPISFPSLHTLLSIPFIPCCTLLMPLNPFHPFLFINHLFLLAHAIVSSLSTINPPHYPVIPSLLLPIFLSFYSLSSFPFMSLFLIPDHPIIPYHSTFFIFYLLSSLPISYPLPYPLSSIPFIPCHPSLLSTIIPSPYIMSSPSFIIHHPSLLFHVIPSSLFSVTHLYTVLSPLLYSSPPLSLYLISSLLLY